MLLMAMLNTFAQGNKGVTLVSYEQTWLDNYGTLAIRNNTKGTIHNLKFQIIYTDMHNKPVDYKDFFKKVEIEPGMVKKLNITAYEPLRNYEYYKNASGYSDHKKFKIQFKLKGINVAGEPETDIIEDSIIPDDSESIMFSFIITALIIIVLSIGLYVLVAVMAQHRNRNIALWIIISLFITPLITIFILLCIGKDN